MVGSVSLRIIPFVLLVTCASLCQQRQDNHAWNKLPDAPSAEILRAFTHDTGSVLTRAPIGFGTELPGSPERANRIPSTRTAFVSLDEPPHEDSPDILEKYLYAPLLKRNPPYHPSTSASFMSRAAYATTSTFVTRDDSGSRRLNTSYFLGMLSSAVIHSAYRPYWRRSVSDPFGDFGSNIGNDAGMNLVHEFGPGIEQLMRSHAPKIVAKIEARISHN